MHLKHLVIGVKVAGLNWGHTIMKALSDSFFLSQIASKKKKLRTLAHKDLRRGMFSW